MYFDDLVLHTVYDLEPVEIQKQKMMDFAREYDNLPLHTDEDYAKATIFGGLIAPGVMSFMTVWSKFLELNVFGDQLIAGKSSKIEWFKPVYPGDILTGRVELTALTDRNPKNGIAEFTLHAWNQQDQPVLSGVTEVILKKQHY